MLSQKLDGETTKSLNFEEATGAIMCERPDGSAIEKINIQS
jgi:hypothetical protein